MHFQTFICSGTIHMYILLIHKTLQFVIIIIILQMLKLNFKKLSKLTKVVC